MSKLTKNFKQLTKKDVDLAGGKGASLGEMTDFNIPVPPGFVVLAQAFDQFLEENDLIQEINHSLSKINYDDVNSVDKASMIIRDLISDAVMPESLEDEIVADFKKLKAKYVAVRSSATAEDSSIASWAGELDSFLDTTEGQLIANVKNCWSSLFTPRACFYRKEKKLLETHIGVAVVIQKMVESEISGICFTVHPVTEDQNQMIIEAGWGLGDAIVSGAITPDSYVIDKRDWSLMDINISPQTKKVNKDDKNGGVKWSAVEAKSQEIQKLTGKEIIELAKICVGIEKHYKAPQDIEWAMFKSKFYITQSRPITTL